MLQVRFELTTSAFLAPFTVYKYGALTDCATGAGQQRVNKTRKNHDYKILLKKDEGPVILARLHHHFHSRMPSHYYSMWRL